jgi:N-acetylneuraminate synthase
MYGSDQAASIEARNLKNLSEVILSVSKILGDGEKKITETEEKIRKKLRIEKK